MSCLNEVFEMPSSGREIVCIYNEHGTLVHMSGNIFACLPFYAWIMKCLRFYIWNIGTKTDNFN